MLIGGAASGHSKCAARDAARGPPTLANLGLLNSYISEWTRKAPVSRFEEAVDWAHGTKGFLDHFHIPRSGRGFSLAIVVGRRCDDSNFRYQLVVGLPERLV